MSAWITPSHMAVLIPILFICGAIVVAIVAVIINGRNKDLDHRERLLAMEKGIPLPEPKIETKPRKPPKPIHSLRRAWGLIFVGIGLGLIIAIGANAGFAHGLWGLLALFIGLGLIIGAMLDKKEFEQREKRKDFSNGPMPGIND